MRQLPLLIEQTADLRQRPDFELLSLCFDDPSRRELVDKAIADYGISHAVLWNETGSPERSNMADWNIPGFPTTLLIDPQGNIVLELAVDNYLRENLLFFLDHWTGATGFSLQIEPYRAAGSGNAAEADSAAEVESVLGNDPFAEQRIAPDANQSISVGIVLYNPDHQPLDVQVDVRMEKTELFDEGPVHRIMGVMHDVDYRAQGRLLDYRAEFPVFGDEHHVIVVDDLDGVLDFEVEVAVPVPGSEALNGGQGLFYRKKVHVFTTTAYIMYQLD
ncbi:MAG: hypothetical protein R3F46_01400 [bacterium]